METEVKYTSICCGAPAVYPGYPDSDVCERCKEHSGFRPEGEEEDD